MQAAATGGGECPAPGDGTAGESAGSPPGKPCRSVDAMDVFPQAHGSAPAGHLQPDAEEGVDAGSPELMVGMHWVESACFTPRRNVCWKRSGGSAVRTWWSRWCRIWTGRCAKAWRGPLPGVPFVTILTDIADYPPHFWMENRLQGILSSSAAGGGAGRSCIQKEKEMHRVSGMILNPRSTRLLHWPGEPRAAARAKLGFDPAKPVDWCCSGAGFGGDARRSRAGFRIASCC